jgi:hypothetical protein
MFLVLINQEKHSIWNTFHEANHQIDVLVGYGYPSYEMDIMKIETNEYLNGQYFM